MLKSETSKQANIGIDGRILWIIVTSGAGIAAGLLSQRDVEWGILGFGAVMGAAQWLVLLIRRCSFIRAGLGIVTDAMGWGMCVITGMGTVFMLTAVALDMVPAEEIPSDFAPVVFPVVTLTGITLGLLAGAARALSLYDYVARMRLWLLAHAIGGGVAALPILAIWVGGLKSQNAVAATTAFALMYGIATALAMSWQIPTNQNTPAQPL